MKRTVEASSGGAELCVETFGGADDPALLLIAGAACSMDFWEDELCARLAGRGLHVVRYDPRDTGGSTAYPPGEPGYTGRDLAEDAVAVLDGAGIDRAHLAGLSMGGAIAQELGLAHRDRVRSLVVMSTTFARDAPEGLPGPSSAISDEPPEPDWADRGAVVEYLVAGERRFSGPEAFDEARARALAERVFDRSRDVESAVRNHWLVEHGDAPPGRLTDLAGLPVLVVHGTTDPVFPIEHGRALAAAIPGARLLELEGVGHQLPPERDWDRFVDAVGELVSDA